MGLGSEIRDPEKNLFRIRVQGSKRHRIRICNTALLSYFFTVFIERGSDCAGCVEQAAARAPEQRGGTALRRPAPCRGASRGKHALY
jgi:hypothetical protein